LLDERHPASLSPFNEEKSAANSARSRASVKHRVFPFEAKSTRYLLPGDFWAIPLRDRSFACGRVIQLQEREDGSLDSRLFLAGLLDWVGDMPPTSATIVGCLTVIQGQAHVRTIQTSGGVILGHRPLADDGIEPALMLSHTAGPDVMLQRGFVTLRPASEQERSTLPVFPTFGFSFMSKYAEAHLFAA